MPMYGNCQTLESFVEINNITDIYIRHNVYDCSFDIILYETQKILKTLSYENDDIKHYFYSFDVEEEYGN